MKRTDATILVGALDETGERTSFSNYGDAVDVFAPGEMIAGAGIDGKIVKMSGTSMASPLIAGLVAALLSLEPDADLERIRGALIASFDPRAIHLKRAHAGRADYLLEKPRIECLSTRRIPQWIGVGTDGVPTACVSI